MPKYKVIFQTMVQTDGWTNPSQDYEEKVVRETVTVKARNKTLAVKDAVKKTFGYIGPRYGDRYSWGIDQAKRVTQIKKKRC
jgi:hypothetical protein